MLDVGSAPVAAKVAAHSTQPQLRAAAVLTVISGDVLTRFGASGFASATDGAVLYVGSTVRTSTDAIAVITLFEGSTVELEPASDITIEEATMRSGSTIIELAQSLGRSWHVVTHLTTVDSRYEVKTPAATASVRGTSFEVAVEDGFTGAATTVTTTEGLVATTETGGASEVLVGRGETTTVYPRAAPASPRGAPAAQRVVTVSAASEASLVVDPLGRANGLRDGRVIAQTPGARVTMLDGTIVVTLPNVPDGVFATTVAASAAPVIVSTTVSDKGEDPVTVTNTAGSGSLTSAVELRSGRDKPDVRALTAEETKQLRGANGGRGKATIGERPNPTAGAGQGTARGAATQTKKADPVPVAATPRRSPAPSPSQRR